MRLFWFSFLDINDTRSGEKEEEEEEKRRYVFFYVHNFTCYLIDGINIQLFKVERERDNRFVMHASPIQSLADGGLDILYSLVAQPPETLGLVCSFKFTLNERIRIA